MKDKDKVFKRYAITVTVVIATSLVFISAFNWFVNPYKIYTPPLVGNLSFPNPEAGDFTRLTKAYQIRRIKPQVVCLGTSRAQAIDVEYGVFDYTPAYNLAVGGANIYEITRYFQHAHHIQPLKQALLFLDFFSFNSNHPNRPDFNESRLSITYEGKDNSRVYLNDIVDTLISFDAFATSINCFKYKLSENNEGSVNKKGYHAQFLKSEMVYARDEYIRFDFEDKETHKSSFDYYRKILQISYRDNIDLRLAISPSHVRQWEVLADCGLWTKFEEWKRTLTKINEEEAYLAGKTPFALWDFSLYNEYTTEPVPPLDDVDTEMRWYSDSSHYSAELGRLVLDYMFGYKKPDNANFGVVITSQDIEQHLQGIRIDRQHYRDTHPDDIKEIEELVSKYL